jgi:membrane protease YdiL (CAAX protease family)
MAAIYCVGVALSYTRGKTGSLLPAYLMHLGYNATLFVSLYLTTDQFRALQG